MLFDKKQWMPLSGWMSHRGIYSDVIGQQTLTSSNKLGCIYLGKNVHFVAIVAHFVVYSLCISK